MKKKFLIIIPVLLFSSFWIGTKYQLLKSNDETLIVFANVLGESISQVDKLFANELTSSNLYEYYQAKAVAVGCSMWIDDLTGDKKHLKMFIEGITIAFNRTEGYQSKCRNKIEEFISTP